MTRFIAFPLAAVAFLLACPVWGGTTAVSTVEFGSWPATVNAVENDTHAEGTVVHLRVTDPSRGAPLACAEYTVSLDAAGQAAFAIEGCDDGLTALRLVHRDALFVPGDVVSQPREIALTVVETVTVHGGPQNMFAAAVTCSVAVRPFLRDVQHGTEVPLTPGRFTLRAQEVVVTTVSDGWTLATSHRGTMSVAYDVVDTETDRVVLHDRATIACAEAPVRSSAISPTPPPGGGAAAARGYPWAVSFGLGAAAGSVPLRDVAFQDGALEGTGRTLGLGAGGYAFVGPHLTVSMDAPWVFVSGSATWASLGGLPPNSSMQLFDVTLTGALSFRLGPLLMYAGPTLRFFDVSGHWYGVAYGSTSPTLHDGDSDNLAFAGTLGVRERLGSGRSALSWVEIAADFTMPIAGGGPMGGSLSIVGRLPLSSAF